MLSTVMEATAHGSQDIKHTCGFHDTINQGIHWNITRDGRNHYSPADSMISSKQWNGRLYRCTYYHYGGEHQANACKFHRTEFFTVRSENILLRYADTS